MKTISPRNRHGRVADVHSVRNACRSGVRRTHLVNRHVDGAQRRLFSRDGHGLLISRDVYEGVRCVRVCHNQSLTHSPNVEKTQVRKAVPKRELDQGTDRTLEKRYLDTS